MAECCGTAGHHGVPPALPVLGQVAELQDGGGWNNSAMPKLWLYNLHYFDDLRAEGAEPAVYGIVT